MEVTLPADLRKQVEQESPAAGIRAAMNSSNRLSGTSSTSVNVANGGWMRFVKSVNLSTKPACTSAC